MSDVSIIKRFYNRPFPSYFLPLFQNESRCETIQMEMSLICMKVVVHYRTRFETEVKGNSEIIGLLSRDILTLSKILNSSS